MAGQNQAKLLEMFNYNYIKIVPRNVQGNELNFEKIMLGGSCKQVGIPKFLLKKLE